VLYFDAMSDKFDGQGHRSKFAVVGRKNAVNCLKSESKSVEKTSVWETGQKLKTVNKWPADNLQSAKILQKWLI